MSVLKKQFLEAQGIGLDDVHFLAQDMSPRQYYRLKDKGLLLMEGPHETLVQFVHIATLLNRLGATVPRVVAFEGEHAMIEDWGDDTLTKLLQQGFDAAVLYREAVDTLVSLHKACLANPDVSQHLQPYDASAMVGEAMLFSEWCFDEPLSENAKRHYQNIWESLWRRCPPTPQVLVLRDYHVDNLMRTPGGKLGLLDFQDALWGACVYDLTSLLEDARTDVPSNVVEASLQQYKQAMGFDDSAWKDVLLAYNIWGLGRHLKILGVFTRYAKKQGNTSKLVHLPRVWGHVNRLLKEDVFADLKVWMRECAV